jgi:class 3 adenylate cyclase
VREEARRLAAIMFTDIVGFSRRMGADEARTMRLLNVHNVKLCI